MLGSSCSACCQLNPCNVESVPTSIRVAYAILDNKNGSYAQCAGFGESQNILYLQSNAASVSQSDPQLSCQIRFRETFDYWKSGAAYGNCQSFTGSTALTSQIDIYRTACSPTPASGYRRQVFFRFPVSFGPVRVEFYQACEYRISSSSSAVLSNSLSSQCYLYGPNAAVNGAGNQTTASDVFGQTISAGNAPGFAETFNYPTLTWPITIYSRYFVSVTGQWVELYLRILGVFDQDLNWIMFGPYGEKPSGLP